MGVGSGRYEQSVDRNGGRFVAGPYDSGCAIYDRGGADGVDVGRSGGGA